MREWEGKPTNESRGKGAEGLEGRESEKEERKEEVEVKTRVAQKKNL